MKIGQLPCKQQEYISLEVLIIIINYSPRSSKLLTWAPNKFQGNNERASLSCSKNHLGWFFQVPVCSHQSITCLTQDIRFIFHMCYLPMCKIYIRQTKYCTYCKFQPMIYYHYLPKSQYPYMLGQQGLWFSANPKRSKTLCPWQFLFTNSFRCMILAQTNLAVIFTQHEK